MGVDFCQQGFHVPELPLDGKGKRSDRAFHPLQDVHAQQVDEAFLAIHLAEKALAAANFSAVFLVISRLLVRKHIAKQRIGAEGQAADFVIDLSDGPECAGEVHVGLDVHRRQALGELARFCGAVISLHMLSRPGDGQHVEQFEVIEAKHIHEAGWPTFGLAKIKPAVELPLRLADRSFDAGDAMARQRHIVTLSNECDLIFEVGQPIVDRRRRQHEHFGLHAGLDDPLHQVVVAGVPILVGRLVPKIMRLVDHDEIVITPVDVGEVDVAGQAAIA